MKRKKRKIYLYLLIILGITVGFALLSTTLNINGTAGIKKNTWDIHWDEESIQVAENSVQVETPTVTDEGQKVSYEVTLELPGDFYEFTIDAVNAGTIDGMVNIDGLNPTIKNKTTGEVTTLPSYIKYSVTYADGSPIEEFHKLAKRVDENTPTREKFKIRIEYDSNSSELPGEDKEFEIDDDLPYIPDDGNGKDRNTKVINFYMNHLGKSETLDPTWTYYFKGREDTFVADHIIYTISGFSNNANYEVNNANVSDLLTFDSLNDCESYLADYSEYFSDSYHVSLQCSIKYPVGTQYTKYSNVSACMKSNNDTICFDSGSFDINDPNGHISNVRSAVTNSGGYCETESNENIGDEILCVNDIGEAGIWFNHYYLIFVGDFLQAKGLDNGELYECSYSKMYGEYGSVLCRKANN